MISYNKLISWMISTSRGPYCFYLKKNKTHNFNLRVFTKISFSIKVMVELSPHFNLWICIFTCPTIYTDWFLLYKSHKQSHSKYIVFKKCMTFFKQKKKDSNELKSQAKTLFLITSKNFFVIYFNWTIRQFYHIILFEY